MIFHFKYMNFIKNLIKKYKYELIIAAVISFIIVKLITHYVFYLSLIPSESMTNTLAVGDKVYVSKNIFPLQKGEIYTFYHDNKLLIKRLIATGGDKIEINGDKVYVNNIKLNEPYVSSYMNKDKQINLSLIVPDGKCFFLGDNRNYSYDSRFWPNPFIDESEIDGRAIKIVSPKEHKANL